MNTTPGPWRVEGRFVKAMTDKYVAECPMGNVYHAKVDTANAVLISAAPDLLAALEGVLRVADRKTDEFDAARDAIAKAKGTP